MLLTFIHLDEYYWLQTIQKLSTARTFQEMMDGVIKRSFDINLKVLHLLGLYSPQKPSKSYVIYGYTVLICSLLPDPIFSVLYFLKSDEINMLEAGFNLFCTAFMICFIPKLLPFIIKGEGITNCIHFIESGIEVTLNEKQQKIVDECVRICRRNSLFFFSCVVVNIVSWCVRPLLLSRGRKLPMDVWLPFDPTASTATFWFTYIIISLGSAYSGLVSASIDPLIGGLAYHTAGQIMVLKDNLQNLSEYVDSETTHTNYRCNRFEKYMIKSELIYKKLGKCVENHNAIIMFVNKMENSFSLVVFSQFVGSSVIICFCCLQISKLEIGTPNFLLMVIYLNSALIQIYFYCFYGTTVSEESKSLTTAAYMGQWYDYDFKSRKILVTLMERSNKPMVVTAGKLLDLSLDTFTIILKRSYSLLAVMENY